MAKTASNRIGAGDIQDLAVAVEQLTEETRILRQSLDELRDDVVWAARQVMSAGYQITGTPPPRPLDPLAPNAVLDDDDAGENAEGIEYCCGSPRLMWNGDPDSPGITCASCGYLVANEGSVLIWRDDESAFGPEAPDPAPPTSTNRQARLFGDVNDW